MFRNETTHGVLTLAVLLLCTFASGSSVFAEDKKACPKVRVGTDKNGQPVEEASRAPSTTKPNPDDADSKSEHDVLKNVIDRLKASADAKLKALGQCMSDKLTNGEICVSDKPMLGSLGEPLSACCFQDKKSTWGGDVIVINKDKIDGGRPGTRPGASATQKNETWILGSIVAHEGGHAGDGSGSPNYDKKGGYADSEAKASEAHKAALKDCGFPTDSKYYKYLCEWIAAVKANGLADPSGPRPAAPNDCPAARADFHTVYAPGANEDTGDLVATVCVSPIDTSVLRVATCPAGDHEVQLGMDVVTGLALYYPEVQGAKRIAVLAVGRNAQATNGYTQVVILALNGAHMETRTVQTHTGVPFVGLASTESATPMAYILSDAPRTVRRVSDHDSDGIPTQVATTAFATAAQWPHLETVRHFASRWDGFVETSEWEGFRSGRVDEAGAAVLQRLYDNNDDGVAETLESVTLHNIVDRGSPTFRDHPAPGAASISACANTGSLVEIWTCSALGVRAALLGSAMVPSNDWIVTIPLSRQLIEGEYVLLREQAREYVSTPRLVDDEQFQASLSTQTGRFRRVRGTLPSLQFSRRRVEISVRLSGRLGERLPSSPDKAQVAVRLFSGIDETVASLDCTAEGWTRRGANWIWRSTDGRSKLRLRTRTGDCRLQTDPVSLLGTMPGDSVTVSLVVGDVFAFETFVARAAGADEEIVEFGSRR